MYIQLCQSLFKKSSALLVIFMLIFSPWIEVLDNPYFSTVVKKAHADTTGAKFPTLGESVSETPWLSDTWVTPTNIYSDNAATANIIAASFDSPDQSYVLKATGFDFSAIPDGSTIQGITISTNAFYRTGQGSGSLSLCQLLNTSKAKVGTNLCATPTALTTTNTTIITKGGATELWGNGLTAAWVKSANFGVALGVTATAANADVDIDYVTVEVHYTPPANVTIASSQGQPAYVVASSNDVILGASSIVGSLGGGHSVTAITLKENSGTIDASSEMSDIELWLSDDQTWDVGDNQLGTTQNFSGVDGEITFTETFSIATTPKYLIVRGDINSFADIGDTAEIQVKTITTGDAVFGAPLEISGTTAVWNKKKELVFDNSGQAENLTDFPVLVKLDTSRITYGDVGKVDGTDLRFVDSDTLAELDYEIEKWDSAGNSYIWVKVPQIDASSSGDSIWMFYGNAGASDGQDVTNVWSNNYQAVYHFNETTGSYLDSTANNHDSDVVSVTSRAASKFGNAVLFDGVDDYITIPDSTGFDITNWTITSWINKNGTGIAANTGSGGDFFYPLVTKGMAEAESDAADITFMTGIDSDYNKMGVDFENNTGGGNNPLPVTPASQGTTVSNGTWYQYDARVDTTGNTLKVYMNGVEDSSRTITDTPNQANSVKVAIGAGSKTTGIPALPADRGAFNGYVDEVIISRVTRSAAWIKASYLSMNDTFITWPGALTMSSAANQTFTENDAPTSISTISITDGATPSVTAANNIRIRIPSGFNMTWDTSDTTANIGGTNWSKTGAGSSGATVTVTYEDSGRTVVVPVTSDFTASNDITVYGLSFSNFTDVSSADNLELVLSGAGGGVSVYDTKTIEVLFQPYQILVALASKINQVFNTGDATTLISPLTMTASTTNPITTGDDIRIKIPSGFNMTWDDADTAATVKVAPTLSEYTSVYLTNDLPTITLDNSGVAYNALTDTLFFITNGTPTIYEFQKDGTYLRTITMSGFIDTEGIEWMYGTTYAVTEERSPYDIITFTMNASTTSVTKAGGTSVNPGISVGTNLGMEGITYDAANNWFYVVVEKQANSSDGGRVFKVLLDGTATELTALGASLSAMGITDLADLSYSEVSGHLFLLSQENSVIIEAKTDGTIIRTRAVDTGTFAQVEGLDFSPDGNSMFIAGEVDDYQHLTRPSNKVSQTVSYENSNKTLVVNVTNNFTGEEVVSIADLSFENFSAGSAADNLELVLAGVGGATVAYDSKTIEINGLLVSADIVDASFVSVSNPAIAMSTTTFGFSCQTITGTFGTPTQQIYVNNNDSADAGWTLTLAALSNTDVWDSSGIDYDFNDATGSGCTDGGDADTLGGQMTVNPVAGTLSVGECVGCTASEITKGSSAAYSQGSVDTITLLSAAAASDDIGDWTLQGIAISQKIPANQPAASDYNVDMVLTVTAN